MLDTPYRIIRGRVLIPRMAGKRIEAKCATVARASIDRRY